MEIKKVNLDRENLTSGYIEQKQNFKEILNHARLSKTSEWKSSWFYGAVGLSSFAIASIISHDFETKNSINEIKITQKEAIQKVDKTQFSLNKIDQNKS